MAPPLRSVRGRVVKVSTVVAAVLLFGCAGRAVGDGPPAKAVFPIRVDGEVGG
jgi:hypothetical protein